MPWSAYALFLAISLFFGYGVFRIFTGEENPAHTTRLGNVRASPIEVSEPRPNRFALEEDMERLPVRKPISPPTEDEVDEPDSEFETIAEPMDAELSDEETQALTDDLLDSSEAILAEIGAKWDTNHK